MVQEKIVPYLTTGYGKYYERWPMHILPRENGILYIAVELFLTFTKVNDLCVGEVSCRKTSGSQSI